MSKKIIISGYYGVANIGDELILESIIKLIKDVNSSYKIIALSVNPSYTRNTYNVGAIRQFPNSWLGFFRSLLNFGLVKLLYHLLTADAFILGGGGFLSDRQSHSVPFWTRQLRIAKIFGLKTIVFRIGAGPFFTQYGIERTKEYLTKYADEISVRDRNSYNILKEKVKVNKEILLNIDPVAFYNNNLTQAGESASENTILFVLTNFNPNIHVSDNINIHLMDLFHAMIETAEKKSYNPLILFFEPKSDQLTKKYLSKFIKNKNTLIDVHSPKEAVNLFQKSKGVISFRLHGNILAYAMNKPFMPIIYHHKHMGFLDMINYLNRDLILKYSDGIISEQVNKECWTESAEKFIRLIESGAPFYSKKSGPDHFEFRI